MIYEMTNIYTIHINEQFCARARARTCKRKKHWQSAGRWSRYDCWWKGGWWGQHRAPAAPILVF